VNYSRKDSDWMWQNLALAVEWLITGTVSLHLVLILALLTRSIGFYTVQCFTSPPTQYRLYGRQYFYRSKDPTNSI